MKLCVPCSTVCDDAVATCQNCGEASFVGYEQAECDALSTSLTLEAPSTTTRRRGRPPGGGNAPSQSN